MVKLQHRSWIYRPGTRDQGVAFLSSQSYGVLGKPSAGSDAEIFFHSRSLPADHGPVKPHSVVSAIKMRLFH